MQRWNRSVLKQIDEKGENKPVAYFSRKLTEAQKKKKAIYLECLAIKEAVKYWQHWLMGKEFTVYSDHKPLENLNLKARTDEELGDLTYYLSQYNFKVRYNPGKTNQEANCLSRNAVLEPDENLDDFITFVNHYYRDLQVKECDLINLKEIQEDQEKNLTTEEKKTN